ncbi:hypothetical protein [Paracoccus yeei]|uniref:hypothetical protein n=1 Tax=Paracoccus yeei TaxID=147645 RepID=UPI001C8D129F|nr:hypothetical protein [Paracoccus yeei]MBY0137490.1 hypothetical protein [Paracoccus yeei]
MADQNNAPELPDRIWAWSEDDDFLRAKPHGVMHGTEYVRADRAAPEGQGYFGPMGIPHWSRALTPPPAAQEPVAWATYWDDGGLAYLSEYQPKPPSGLRCVPLYAAPPPASQQEAVTVALKLAAARLQRLALGIPSTTPLRADVFEWAEEALRALKGENNADHT